MCILDIEELTLVNEEELKPFEPNKFEVRKTGRTTGETTGFIEDTTFSIDKWLDCYKISKHKSVEFSKKGDSGSGVFLVEKDGTQKPLGILLGNLKRSKHKLVCKIDRVLDNHGLKIVKFAPKTQHKTILTCHFNCFLAIICAIICMTLASFYIFYYKEHSSPALSAAKHIEL